MDRKQFAIRFHEAVDLTIANTRQLCFNDFNPAHKFIVSTNSSKTPVILDDTEMAYVKMLKDISSRPLLFDEVLDLLQVGDKQPLWINISVYKAAPDATLLELVCSRRLRKAEDMPNNVDKFPPFHIWIPMPTDKVHNQENNKIDVNWRVMMAEKDKNKGFMSKIKNYFAKS